MMSVAPARPGLTAAALTIQLLGGFSVRVGEHVVPSTAWRLRKAAHLVKLLALATGHRLHRDQLCDLLWPEIEPAAAYNNLRYALHVARQALASAGMMVLPMQQGIVLLAPDAPVVIDVEVFIAAAVHCTDDLAQYHASIALYTGDLLPDDRYEEWTTAHREDLRARLHDLCLACAQAHAARGEYAEALPLVQRVVAAEPTHEDAHVLLMRLHASRGHRAAAITQFARLRTALAEEVGVAPSAASQQCYTDIITGIYPAVPPLTEAALPASPGAPTLPVPLTRFIGRARECAAVADLLTQRRVVTLLGAGGCGKTRLALAVAGDEVANYPDGVWLIDCAPLTDAAQVAQTVATTLGLRGEGGRPPLAVLTQALRSRHLLLVLDNCEHLLDACGALVVALLGSCAHLRVLATSRAALEVAGEATWRVPSLTLPGAQASLEDLAASEAVQLFVDRACWRQPDFSLTAENAKAVAAICRRLDGMPLALELAAARLNVLTVDQIVTHLDDALRLLSAGGRTAIPRQQTLRATLDWSYGFLAEPTRLLLGRLAIFAGGCDMAAVES
nr:AAA family ATPase [Ktedonobacterales bacterium]